MGHVIFALDTQLFIKITNVYRNLKDQIKLDLCICEALSYTHVTIALEWEHIYAHIKHDTGAHTDTLWLTTRVGSSCVGYTIGKTNDCIALCQWCYSVNTQYLQLMMTKQLSLLTAGLKNVCNSVVLVLDSSSHNLTKSLTFTPFLRFRSHLCSQVFNCPAGIKDGILACS